MSFALSLHVNLVKSFYSMSHPGGFKLEFHCLHISTSFWKPSRRLPSLDWISSSGWSCQLQSEIKSQKKNKRKLFINGLACILALKFMLEYSSFESIISNCLKDSKKSSFSPTSLWITTLTQTVPILPMWVKMNTDLGLGMWFYWPRACLACRKPWVQLLTLHKLGVAMYAYNLNTGEVEAGRWEAPMWFLEHSKRRESERPFSLAGKL